MENIFVADKNYLNVANTISDEVVNYRSIEVECFRFLMWPETESAIARWNWSHYPLDSMQVFNRDQPIGGYVPTAAVLLEINTGSNCLSSIQDCEFYSAALGTIRRFDSQIFDYQLGALRGLEVAKLPSRRVRLSEISYQKPDSYQSDDDLSDGRSFFPPRSVILASAGFILTIIGWYRIRFDAAGRWWNVTGIVVGCILWVWGIYSYCAF